jgi:hypothetical protein
MLRRAAARAGALQPGSATSARASTPSAALRDTAEAQLQPGSRHQIGVMANDAAEFNVSRPGAHKHLSRVTLAPSLIVRCIEPMRLHCSWRMRTGIARCRPLLDAHHQWQGSATETCVQIEHMHRDHRSLGPTAWQGTVCCGGQSPGAAPLVHEHRQLRVRQRDTRLLLHCVLCPLLPRCSIWPAVAPRARCTAEQLAQQ